MFILKGMRKESGEISSEAKTEHLKELLAQALEGSLETKKLQALWQNREHALLDFINKKKSIEQLNDVIRDVEKKAPAIRLKNVTDFQHILTLAGVNDQRALETTKHEADHFYKAKEMGLDPEFVVEFSYDLQLSARQGYYIKSTILHPKVAIGWGEDMPVEKVREAIARTFEATEEPSQGDIDLVTKFK